MSKICSSRGSRAKLISQKSNEFRKAATTEVRRLGSLGRSQRILVQRKAAAERMMTQTQSLLVSVTVTAPN